MNRSMPAFKSEKCLARSRICDYFDESFFQTICSLLATMSILRTEECFICDYTYGDSFDDSFGFQSWHSLVEFRPYVHRFMYNIPELDHPQQVDTGRYNRHESIVTPVAHFLLSRGVDFHFHATVTDIIVEPSHQQLSTTCTFKDNEPEMTIEVGPQNIVIVSVGSVMSGAKTLTYGLHL